MAIPENGATGIWGAAMCDRFETIDGIRKPSERHSLDIERLSLSVIRALGWSQINLAVARDHSRETPLMETI